MALKQKQVTQQDLLSLQDEVQTFLKESGWPTLLTQAERSPYGLGAMGNQILSLLEEVLSSYTALSAVLSDTLLEEEVPPQEGAPPPGVADLAALHMALWHGTRVLDELTDYSVRTVNTFRLKEIRALLSQPVVEKALLGDMLQYVREQFDGHLDSLLRSLCAWFHLMVATLSGAAADPRYRRQLRTLARYEVRLFSLRFSPFKAPLTPQEERSVHLPITLDHIIGNHDYREKGEHLVRDLLAFDPQEGRNPKTFNQILFGLGRPGCGKTATAYALGNHLLECAERVGLDAKFVVIRRTDWASSYQNASSRALLSRFQEALEGFRGVVLFYWPDIDTAFSSRSSGDLRSEERGILGTAFGLFDGTLLPFNGQWGLLCDANYMQLDEATVSRLSQDPCVVQGPQTAEEYVALLRDVLLGEEYSLSLELTEEEWLLLGKRARAGALSGRDLANLSRRLIALMEDFPYPEGFFELDYEGRREAVRRTRKRLDAGGLHAQFTALEHFKEEAARIEEEERVRARVEELTLELRAKEAFLKQVEAPFE